jgi:asparaginyl-tRNA synthetase
MTSLQKKNYITHAINDLLSDKVTIGSKVVACGWVRTRRDSNAGISFIGLHDGSCFQSLQIVAPNTLENYSNDILQLTPGCSIVVYGELIQSPAKGQKYELQAHQIKFIGGIDDPETYPISPKHHTLEYLREHAHLRMRTNVIGAVTRVQHCVSQAIHRFFHERGFFWIHTPIITTNDSEGAGQLFRVTTLDLLKVPCTNKNQIDFAQDYFGREAYLTVSGQLNVETYCEAMSKVYTFGPTFRAENFNTTRHISEFWMVEPEVAFADLLDIIKLAENLLKYLCKSVLEERQDDLAFFVERIDKESINRIEKIVNSQLTYMDYTDAINVLEKANKKFVYPVKWGLDLQTEHERYLSEELVKGPVAVLNYPKAIKSFYMRGNDDDKTVAAMDILVPDIGEIIGGSQREERLEMLDKRMDELKMDKQLYWWYRDLRRYGTVPHAGFGLGFERFVGYITGVTNIRDIIPFPRTPKHAEF